MLVTNVKYLELTSASDCKKSGREDISGVNNWFDCKL